MAITDTQKVDYLWKKIGYGRAKTDINSIKNATNESISSPLFLRGDQVWSQASLIPSTIPGSNTQVVTLYPTTNPVECSVDITSSTNRTWKTDITDWIPPEIGSTYLVKVYLHTPGQSGTAASSGTQIFGAGSGNDDEWFFDYQSGTLNFIGTNLPSGISGKSVYISGAVYSGIKGVAVPGAGASFTFLDVTGISTFAGGIDVNGSAEIKNIRIGVAASNEIDTSSGDLILDSATGHTLIDDDLTVTGISTFVGSVTFKGGTINLGDENTDNINVLGEFVSNLVPNTDNSYDIGIGTQRWRNANFSGIATIHDINVNNAFNVYSNTSTFHNDLVVDGNLTVNGVETIINVQSLSVFDKQIVLGLGTNGSVLASDLTASGGGISIASTEGNPLVDFNIAGIHTYPNTYKDIIWVKADDLGVGTTDAWHFNYAVGIGSTQIPSGVRFAVSEIQFTDNSITSANINSRQFNSTKTTLQAPIAGNYAGERVRLYDFNNLSKTNYAIGVESNNIWFGVDSNTDTQGFKWYGNTTQAMRLGGSGDLNIAGDLTISGNKIKSSIGSTAITLSGPDVELANTLIVGGLAQFSNGLQVTTGNSTFAGSLSVDGSTTLGNNAGLDTITLNSRISSDLIPTTDSTVDVGSSTRRWAEVWADSLTVDNVQIGVNGTGEIDTDSGNLTLDSAGGTVVIDDGLTVSGITTFSSSVDINGGADISGGETILSSATVSDLTSGRIVLAGTSGSLQDSANLTFGNNGLVVGAGGINVTGVSTFSQLLDANSGAEINNIKIGTSAANEIDTSSGNLILDSATGMTYIDDDLTVAGNLYINGSTTQINTTEIKVEDRTIELGLVDGNSPSATTTWDLGVLFNYHDGTSAKKSGVVWENSTQRFTFTSNVSDSAGIGTTQPQMTYTTFAPIEVSSLWVNDCAGQSQVISCTGTERFLNNITIDGGSF